MYNKAELRGVNTAELPILNRAGEADLLTRARAGDKEARQSMIEGTCGWCSAWCKALFAAGREHGRPC